MGYYTRFSLKVVHPETKAELPEEFRDSVIAKLREESEEAEYCLDQGGNSSDSGKWYEHEKEFRKFSFDHPDFLFVLHGEGEESGDVWNKYFLRGKCQVAKATVMIPEFDRLKLS